MFRALGAHPCSPSRLRGSSFPKFSFPLPPPPAAAGGRRTNTRDQGPPAPGPRPFIPYFLVGAHPCSRSRLKGWMC
eukprot:scaffold196647_cov32-Tisochrysis_lutea.AAC.2